MRPVLHVFRTPALAQHLSLQWEEALFRGSAANWCGICPVVAAFVSRHCVKVTLFLLQLCRLFVSRGATPPTIILGLGGKMDALVHTDRAAA